MSGETGRTSGPPLLRITGLTKDFPGLRALDDVSLEIASGEIVAVVGHNGSGKSTLVKVLAGVYSRGAGEVELYTHDGDAVGIHIIHQDLGLALELDAVENLGITRSQGLVASLSPFDRRAEHAHARSLLNRFGDPFSVNIPVAKLAPAQRSIIAIARALDGWDHPHNVLILDEPTEALHAGEVEVLFDAVRSLAAHGAGIIFISHRLDEVLQLADRVIVLRDGKKVADESRETIDHDRLVSFVTGIPVGQAEHGRTPHLNGELVLEIAGLAGEFVGAVDLNVHAGEVVGIAGTLGSGREDLPAMIFGSLPATTDRYELAGESYDNRAPSTSIARGIAFVPGDRTRLGSIPLMNARENMTLPDTSSVVSRLGALDVAREKAEAAQLVSAYDVKPSRTEQRFAQFSGGNQQKIVFAKWLRNDPVLLLLEEPTQGVDIGAKRTIYNAIDAAAARGVGVIVCSSEAKELVRLCDRVLVLRNGTISAELKGEELTETRLVLEGYGLTSGGSERA